MIQGDVLLAHTAGNHQRVGLLPIFCAVKDKNKNAKEAKMAMRHGRGRSRAYTAQVMDVPVAVPQYASRSAGGRALGQRQQFVRVPRPLSGRVPPPAAMYAPRGATETKSVDTAYGTVPFLTAGTVSATPLNIPVNGAALYQRIGNKITMKSLQIRGLIQVSSGNAAAVAEQVARVIVFYDRQTNGAAPAVADVLLAVTQAGATSSLVTDGINMNNRDRFYVLMDMQVLLPAVGINGATAASNVTSGIDINGNSGDANQGQYNVNRFIKLKGLETQYKASAGGVGDIAAGGIFIMCISSADANATAAWNLGFSARLRYNDY